MVKRATVWKNVFLVFRSGIELVTNFSLYKPEWESDFPLAFVVFPLARSQTKYFVSIFLRSPENQYWLRFGNVKYGWSLEGFSNLTEGKGRGNMTWRFWWIRGEAEWLGSGRRALSGWLNGLIEEKMREILMNFGIAIILNDLWRKNEIFFGKSHVLSVSEL